MEGERPYEREPEPLDISERVIEIMQGNSPHKAVDLMRLMKSPDITSSPALTLNLTYTNLDFAKWVRSFVNSGDPKQKRTASIRATESQMKEAANVFNSGVDWIQI